MRSGETVEARGREPRHDATRSNTTSAEHVTSEPMKARQPRYCLGRCPIDSSARTSPSPGCRSSAAIAFRAATTTSAVSSGPARDDGHDDQRADELCRADAFQLAGRLPKSRGRRECRRAALRARSAFRPVKPLRDGDAQRDGPARGGEARGGAQGAKAERANAPSRRAGAPSTYPGE